MITSDLNTFCEVVYLGSFSAVARKRGVTPSTVAKAISRLESRINARLFYRNTRSLSLTTDGDQLFSMTRQLIKDSEEILQQFTSSPDAVSGVLRLDIPVFLGKVKVLRAVDVMARQFPNLKFDLVLSDAYNNIILDGTDVAIRIGGMVDSSLVARKIAQQNWILCSTPAYAASLHSLATIESLESADIIGFRLPHSGHVMPWRFAGGQKFVLSANRCRLILSCGESMRQMAIAGLGVAQLPDYMVQDAIQDGQLIELLAEQRPPPTPIFAIMPHRRLMPGRVRLFLEQLEKALSA